MESQTDFCRIGARVCLRDLTREDKVRLGKSIARDHAIEGHAGDYVVYEAVRSVTISHRLRGDRNRIQVPLRDKPCLIVVGKGIVACLASAERRRCGVRAHVGIRATGIAGDRDERRIVFIDLSVTGGNAVHAEGCSHRVLRAIVFNGIHAGIRAGKRPSQSNRLCRDAPSGGSSFNGIVTVVNGIFRNAHGVGRAYVGSNVPTRARRTGSDRDIGAACGGHGDVDGHTIAGHHVTDGKSNALSACGINVAESRRVIVVVVILPRGAERTLCDHTGVHRRRVNSVESTRRTDGIVGFAGTVQSDGNRLIFTYVVNVGRRGALCGICRAKSERITRTDCAVVEFDRRRRRFVVRFGKSQIPVCGRETLGIDGPLLATAVVVLGARSIGLRRGIRTCVLSDVAAEGHRLRHRGYAVTVVMTECADATRDLGGGNGMIASVIVGGKQRVAVKRIGKLRNFLPPSLPSCGSGAPSIVAAVARRNGHTGVSRRIACGSRGVGKDERGGVAVYGNARRFAAKGRDLITLVLRRRVGHVDVSDIEVCGERKGEFAATETDQTGNRQFVALPNAVCKRGIERGRRLIGICGIVCIVSCEGEVCKIGVRRRVDHEGRRQSQRDRQLIHRKGQRGCGNAVIRTDISRRNVVSIRTGVDTADVVARAVFGGDTGRSARRLAARCGTGPRDRHAVAFNDVGEDERGMIRRVVISLTGTVAHHADRDRTTVDRPSGRRNGGTGRIVVIVACRRTDACGNAGDLGVIIGSRILRRRTGGSRAVRRSGSLAGRAAVVARIVGISGAQGFAADHAVDGGNGTYLRRAVVITRRIRAGKGRRDRFSVDGPSRGGSGDAVVGVVHRCRRRGIRARGTVILAVVVLTGGSAVARYRKVGTRRTHSVDRHGHAVAQDHVADGQGRAVVLTVVSTGSGIAAPSAEVARAVRMVGSPGYAKRLLIDRPTLGLDGARFKLVVCRSAARNGGKRDGIGARVFGVEVVGAVCVDGTRLIAKRRARVVGGAGIKADDDVILSDDARNGQSVAVLEPIVRNGVVGSGDLVVVCRTRFVVRRPSRHLDLVLTDGKRGGQSKRVVVGGVGALRSNDRSDGIGAVVLGSAARCRRAAAVRRGSRRARIGRIVRVLHSDGGAVVCVVLRLDVAAAVHAVGVADLQGLGVAVVDEEVIRERDAGDVRLVDGTRHIAGIAEVVVARPTGAVCLAVRSYGVSLRLLPDDVEGGVGRRGGGFRHVRTAVSKRDRFAVLQSCDRDGDDVSVFRVVDESRTVDGHGHVACFDIPRGGSIICTVDNVVTRLRARQGSYFSIIGTHVRGRALKSDVRTILVGIGAHADRVTGVVLAVVIRRGARGKGSGAAVMRRRVVGEVGNGGPVGRQGLFIDRPSHFGAIAVNLIRNSICIRNACVGFDLSLIRSCVGLIRVSNGA